MSLQLFDPSRGDSDWRSTHLHDTPEVTTLHAEEDGPIASGDNLRALLLGAPNLERQGASQPQTATAPSLEGGEEASGPRSRMMALRDTHDIIVKPRLTFHHIGWKPSCDADVANEEAKTRRRRQQQQSRLASARASPPPASPSTELPANQPDFQYRIKPIPRSDSGAKTFPNWNCLLCGTSTTPERRMHEGVRNAVCNRCGLREKYKRRREELQRLEEAKQNAIRTELETSGVVQYGEQHIKRMMNIAAITDKDS